MACNAGYSLFHDVEGLSPGNQQATMSKASDSAQGNGKNPEKFPGCEMSILPFPNYQVLGIQKMKLKELRLNRAVSQFHDNCDLSCCGLSHSSGILVLALV